MSFGGKNATMKQTIIVSLYSYVCKITVKVYGKRCLVLVPRRHVYQRSHGNAQI